MRWELAMHELVDRWIMAPISLITKSNSPHELFSLFAPAVVATNEWRSIVWRPGPQPFPYFIDCYILLLPTILFRFFPTFFFCQQSALFDCCIPHPCTTRSHWLARGRPELSDKSHSSSTTNDRQIQHPSSQALLALCCWRYVYSVIHGQLLLLARDCLWFPQVERIKIVHFMERAPGWREERRQ